MEQKRFLTYPLGSAQEGFSVQGWNSAEHEQQQAAIDRSVWAWSITSVDTWARFGCG